MLFRVHPRRVHFVALIVFVFVFLRGAGAWLLFGCAELHTLVFGFAYFIFATICFRASLCSHISLCVIISVCSEACLHIFFLSLLRTISVACRYFSGACAFLMLSLCIFSVTLSLRAFVELYRVHIFRFVFVALNCVIVLVFCSCV